MVNPITTGRGNGLDDCSHSGDTEQDEDQTREQSADHQTVNAMTGDDPRNNHYEGSPLDRRFVFSSRLWDTA